MSRNSLSNSSLLSREEEQGWPWVWELIGRPRPETHQRLRIRVADTVVFREGYPRTWVFTSKTGDVLRKAPDKLKNELIKEHLLRTAVEHNNRVAAVERRGRPSSPPRRKGPGGRARRARHDTASRVRHRARSSRRARFNENRQRSGCEETPWAQGPATIRAAGAPSAPTNQK